MSDTELWSPESLRVLMCAADWTAVARPWRSRWGEEDEDVKGEEEEEECWTLAGEE